MPTLRLAVKPMRGAGGKFDSSGRRAACRIRPGATHFRRLAATARNSGRRLRRATAAMEASRFNPLGRKPLAAFGAPVRQYAATTDRRHTRAKAVTAFADNSARLIGTLQGAAPATLLSGTKSLYTRAVAGSQRRGRAREKSMRFKQ